MGGSCTCRRKRRASQTYGQGRPLLDGDAAAVAVAGNEGGAHKAGADILQALNDVACFLASSEREPDRAHPRWRWCQQKLTSVHGTARGP
ncbi:hypothetical protein [Streptomyces sp. NPDC127574]|uniref:hypothetical protein n=1 Tax=Streptomyces sp. NPDC127574 TaxID=3345401 RepID=UPI00363CDFE3